MPIKESESPKLQKESSEDEAFKKPRKLIITPPKKTEPPVAQ